MLELKSAASRFLVFCAVSVPTLPAFASTPQLIKPPSQPIVYRAPPIDMAEDIRSGDSPVNQASQQLRLMIGLSEQFNRQATSEAVHGKHSNVALGRALDRQEAAFGIFQESLKGTKIGQTVTVIYNPAESKTKSLAERTKDFSAAMERTYQAFFTEPLNENDYLSAMPQIARFNATLQKNLAGYQIEVGFHKEHRSGQRAEAKLVSGGG